jgi:copper resistance protein C
MDRFRPSIFINTVMVFCLALPLYGHAVLLSATPGVNQIARGPDVLMTLRFNARIDAKRSKLTLIAADGHLRSLHIVEDSPPDRLVSEARGLKAGAYVLGWQVLATDGHITRGTLHFRVQ